MSGLTIFLTGLPASGKTTLATSLARRLPELGARHVTVLDGDLVRQQFTPTLGYSRAERERHIRRVCEFAREVTAAGGVAICSLVAPYEADREQARAMIELVGGFVLVYLSTPLEVCEGRDPKGLYAKSRAGLITNFTGVSDPYEPPAHPDVEIDTGGLTPEETAERAIAYLRSAGWLSHRALP